MPATRDQFPTDFDYYVYLRWQDQALTTTASFPGPEHEREEVQEKLRVEIANIRERLSPFDINRFIKKFGHNGVINDNEVYPH